MSWSFYIYYRIDPAKTVEGAAAAQRVLAAMHARTGIAGRLLKKRNEPLLWMEVYENVVDDAAFEWALAEAAAASGLAAALQSAGTRHTECFAA